MGITTRVLVTTAVIALAGAMPAAQAADEPVGRPCAYTAVSWDPVTGPTMWLAEVDAGPVVVAGSTVTLRCSIHVANGQHSGAAAASVTSDDGDGVAAIAPQLVSYRDEYGYAVLCTQVTTATTSWYWTGDAWTTDPTSWCPGPSDPTEPPDLPPQLDWLEAYLWCMHWGWYCPILDYVTCSGTAGAPDVPGIVEFRDDGDIYVAGEWFWDCPPYG